MTLYHLLTQLQATKIPLVAQSHSRVRTEASLRHFVDRHRTSEEEYLCNTKDEESEQTYMHLILETFLLVY
jgi:hypothetical protein